MRASFWGIIAALLAALCVTTALSRGVDHRGALVALGVVGTFSALNAARSPDRWSQVVATTAVLVWAAVRPAALFDSPTARWFGVVVIWAGIAALLVWGRHAVDRLEDYEAALRSDTKDSA